MPPPAAGPGRPLSAVPPPQVIPTTMGEPTIYEYFGQVFLSGGAIPPGVRVNLTTNGAF